MMKLRKDMLRESIDICRQSNLYTVFTRAEKRAAVMHVYSIIDGSRLTTEEALIDLEECNALCR